MTRLAVALLGALSLFTAAGASAQELWKEGVHYFRVSPEQRTTVPPGKVEVLEVFSYGCPACDQFLPVMSKLKAALPPNAQIAYLPASFIPSENWPMFQRMFFTAQALGVVDRTHEAMFDAIWRTGELSITEPGGRKLKKNMPTIEDAAKVYEARAGVKPETFIATAKSFTVEGKMKAADKQILASHVDRTPTIIVNGKYRLHAQSAGGYDQLVALTKWLVERESRSAKLSAVTKP